MIEIINNCKIKINLIVNTVIKSTRNFNDKRTLQIKSKDTTDQLIKKHHDLTEFLKITDLIPEGIKSIIYNFTEIIVSSTLIESPSWLKSKKCSINSQNTDNKCFQYSVTISLNHQKIKNNLERISKIKSFINSLNWDNINFPPQEQDYKTFEINNKSIALNILSIPHNTKKISHVYKSRFTKTNQGK